MSPASSAASGITTNAQGERHIPSSVRADGTKRREIRVRPGYKPPEDVELYKNRSAAAWRNRGKAGIPGLEGLKDSALSVPGTEGAGAATNNKNAKKREAKKRAKTAEGEQEEIKSKGGGALDKENWRAGAPAPAAKEEPKEEVDSEAEKEKKARALKKKLRQARDLREKKDQGENLLPEQFEKVIRMNELIRQLDMLGFDAEGEKKDGTNAADSEKSAAV